MYALPPLEKRNGCVALEASLTSNVYVQPLYKVSAGLSTPSIINLPVAAVTVNVISSSNASATISSEPFEEPVATASVIKPKSSA